MTTRTVEIMLGDIHDYKVSYSKYVELRKERREQQQRAYENQQKQIKDTEDFIERFRQGHQIEPGTVAHQTAGKD